MLARILGSVARQEVEHKGERQRRANEQRRSAGKWVRTGLRKFSYTHDGLPYEPEASALRAAADDVLTGKSLRGISIAWNERGLRTTRGNKFTSMQVRRTLINPLYAGLVTHHEKVIGRGEWQPIIDEATHHGLVAYLSDPARRPAVSFEKRHMLSGVARCGKCDQVMYATYPHGKDVVVYACRPTSHVARRGAPLDFLVEQAVLNYLSGTKIHTLLGKGSKVDVRELQARREALQSRLDGVADELTDMLTRGDIDRRQYSRQYSRGTTDLQSQIPDRRN